MNLEALKREMQEKNISKSQLIKLSGVSETTIRRIWHGKTDVHLSTLRMLADALDVDPMTLLDSDSPVPETFDPANVPEIAAAVLETITIVEEAAPNDTPVILESPPNDETAANSAPSYDGTAANDAPRRAETAQGGELYAAYQEHIRTLQRVIWGLSGACAALLAALIILIV
jgi:transcriptional regulator with XRE-family HTH domain